MTDNLNEEIKRAENIAAQARSLADLKQAIEDFHSPFLDKLRNNAKNTVFSDGSKPHPLMLIGEAPGAEEDEQVMPFAGISGRRLNERLRQCGFMRESQRTQADGDAQETAETEYVYITNAVFWRPPDNRKPKREEIALCRPFLEKQIKLAQPKLIVTLGASAISALTGRVKSMREWREKQCFYETVPIITAYHPSPLSARFWDKCAPEDFKRARKILSQSSISANRNTHND